MCTVVCTDLVRCRRHGITPKRLETLSNSAHYVNISHTWIERRLLKAANPCTEFTVVGLRMP